MKKRRKEQMKKEKQILKIRKITQKHLNYRILPHVQMNLKKIFARIIDQLTFIQEILVGPQYMSDIVIGTIRIVVREINQNSVQGMVCFPFGETNTE